MPIYSARSVRFRMGHPKSGYKISRNCEYDPLPKGADDNFVWTYTSPEFPMAQVGCNIISIILPGGENCYNFLMVFCDSGECVAAVQAARTRPLSGRIRTD